MPMTGGCLCGAVAVWSKRADPGTRNDRALSRWPIEQGLGQHAGRPGPRSRET